MATKISQLTILGTHLAYLKGHRLPFKLERGSITPEEEVDDDDSEHYAQATSSVVPNSRAHVISTAANEK